jgi:hypothetical protein
MLTLPLASCRHRCPVAPDCNGFQRLWARPRETGALVSVAQNTARMPLANTPNIGYRAAAVRAYADRIQRANGRSHLTVCYREVTRRRGDESRVDAAVPRYGLGPGSSCRQVDRRAPELAEVQFTEVTAPLKQCRRPTRMALRCASCRGERRPGRRRRPGDPIGIHHPTVNCVRKIMARIVASW